MKCSFCNREVNPTEHTRTSFKVDYYMSFTGDTESVQIKDDSNDDLFLIFEKLINPRIEIKCVECYFKLKDKH